MGCLSLPRVCVGLWLLVSCLITVGAGNDDVKFLEEMTFPQKLAIIDKKVSKLLRLPSQVQDMQVLLTSLVSQKGTGQKTPLLSTSGLSIPPKQRSQSQRTHDTEHKTSDAMKTSVEEKFQVPAPSRVSFTSKKRRPHYPSTLVMSTTKNFFLLDPKTKKWTTLPVTDTPNSLVYDHLKERLYWCTKKAVGYFTGKGGETEILYEAKDGIIREFTLTEGDGEIFITQSNDDGINLVIHKNDGFVISDDSLWFPSSEIIRMMAVDASSKMLYISTERHKRRRKKMDIIETLSYNYSQKGDTKKTNFNYGTINDLAFDGHTFSTYYNDGNDLHQMKFGVKNSYNQKPLTTCPRVIQKVTTSKQHVYVLDKEHVYVYDRTFALLDKIQLPDLKGDNLKATAAVTVPFRKNI